jgi:hypothetical protein
VTKVPIRMPALNLPRSPRDCLCPRAEPDRVLAYVAAADRREQDRELPFQRVMVALPLTAGVGLCRLLGGSPSTPDDSSPGLHMPRVAAYLANTASTRPAKPSQGQAYWRTVRPQRSHPSASRGRVPFQGDRRSI